MTDLTSWVLDELDDVAVRLRDHVLALVPADLRGERPGGGSSIAWSTLHVGRHADLALTVLTGAPPLRRGALGLGETQPADAPAIDPEDAAAYATTTLAAARAFVAGGPDLATRPDVAGALDRAEIPRDAFGWLFEQWSGQLAAFFVRWPLIGHVQNHVGEMIATRNRLGLSPYG